MHKCYSLWKTLGTVFCTLFSLSNLWDQRCYFEVFPSSKIAEHVFVCTQPCVFLGTFLFSVKEKLVPSQFMITKYGIKEYIHLIVARNQAQKKSTENEAAGLT